MHIQNSIDEDDPVRLLWSEVEGLGVGDTFRRIVHTSKRTTWSVAGTKQRPSVHDQLAYFLHAWALEVARAVRSQLSN